MLIVVFFFLDLFWFGFLLVIVRKFFFEVYLILVGLMVKGVEFYMFLCGKICIKIIMIVCIDVCYICNNLLLFFIYKYKKIVFFIEKVLYWI